MDRQFSFQFSFYLDGFKPCGESDLPAMKIIKANSDVFRSLAQGG